MQNESIKLRPLSLGTSTFGREIDEQTSRELLDYAMDRGIRLIDTAEGYGGGNAQAYRKERLAVDDVREVSGEMYSSEKIIGRWLRDRGCRKEIILLTKVSTGGSPENIHRAVAASLERLGTDFIDIYMMHSPDPHVPLAESWAALSEEVSAGRIRRVGCSNFDRGRIEQIQKLHLGEDLAPLAVAELPLNLAMPQEGHDLLAHCHRQQIQTFGYSPLAAGFLTGKYASAQAEIPRGSRFDVIPGHVDVYFTERNFTLVRKLKMLAEDTGESMAYLAMAWATGHPHASTVLIGARERRHIDNALRAQNEPLPSDWRQRMDGWVNELV